jgi:BASS family bile acid:Na+ symporter
VATALFSVLLVPPTTAMLEVLVVNDGTHVGAATVLRIVALTVLVPLGIGMWVRRAWHGDVERVAGNADKVGTVLLVLAFLPVLIAKWPAIRSLLGDGTLLAIVAFTAIGLFVGHVLGGRDPRDRTVLALATSSRHPAVALAVAAAVFPDQKLAPAAVLLALVVGVLAGMPYTAWRKRLHRKTPGDSLGADLPERRLS